MKLTIFERFYKKIAQIIPFNRAKLFLYRCSGTKIGNNVQIGKNTYLGINCSVGDNCILGNNIVFGINVHLGNNVSIGNNVVINNFYIGDDSIIFKEVITEGGGNCLIKTGHHCSIGTRTILDHSANITIGNYVNMSGIFNTHSSVLNALKGKNVRDESENERIYGDIEIGDNTFIGYFVNVNPNIKIGKNCVILSNVNVDTNIEDNSIVFPGDVRIIKNENLIDYIEKSQKIKKTKFQ